MKITILFTLFVFTLVHSQKQPSYQGKFEQLGEDLPTPNSYRTGSGAPGPKYWQQRADYVLNAEVDDDKQTLTGSGTITYYNNAPEPLSYLWLQLDQNVNADNSWMRLTSTGTLRDSIPAKFLSESLHLYPYKGGVAVADVKDASGNVLPFLINHRLRMG